MSNGWIDFSYADLEDAIGAMESWLDAFGDDEDLAEQVEGVRRALEGFYLVIGKWNAAQQQPKPLLRLVKSEEPEGGTHETE